MNAVRYIGAGQSFQLHKVSLPTCSAEQVLIKVEAASLCHTELHFESGTLNLNVNNITMGKFYDVNM
jgi:propanol-preferring alcohol dehydrogenase